MKAVCVVKIDGTDVSANFLPSLIRLSVSDRAGRSSDSASIDLDDTDGRIVMPREKARVTILLGWEGESVGVVFDGTVDEVRASGSRSGRTISISAKGMDTRGKAKQPQRKHFDDATVEQALSGAGEEAGITVSVDPEFASIKRPYFGLDDESFVAFGERLAKELGGTFKIVGDRAILAKRNGGTAPSGAALSTVTATWGVNLHDYDVSPILGRAVEKSARARWYDPAEAEWQEEEEETGTEDAETTTVSTYPQADGDRAKRRAGSDAAESDRKSGEGSVTIEGNIAAQPEGVLILAGCRPGVDGNYRIEGVDHDYSRQGFLTRLSLGQPKGEAGKDKRSKKKSANSGGDDDDFSLPTDPELG